MKIVLASRNKKKIKEMETLLGELSSNDIEILSLDDIGFTDDIVEDGETFAENSKIKASVPAKLGYIGIADDSGLEVDALDGRPGVYSARYSGENATDESNNEKLLSELSGVPHEKRTARYRTAITCVFPEGDYFSVEGSCEGIILTEADGDGGFGYDPLFYCDIYKKTFGRLTPEEKNGISHRGKAMREFAVKFDEYIKTREGK